MTAHVEAQADPRTPGRTAYRITGATPEQVQDAIGTLMRTVDAAFGGEGGVAQFTQVVRVTHPAADHQQFGALGYVHVFQQQGQAA